MLSFDEQTIESGNSVLVRTLQDKFLFSTHRFLRRYTIGVPTTPATTTENEDSNGSFQISISEFEYQHTQLR